MIESKIPNKSTNYNRKGKSMPYCPNCGSEVGDARFCPSCGAAQGTADMRRPSGAPQQVYVSTRHQYDSTICLLLCCCLSPIAAIIYYMLAEHPEDQYRSQY